MRDRRHNIALCISSKMEQDIIQEMIINGRQYCIYGNLEYFLRAFMIIPYAKADLSHSERCLYKWMETVRLTVELGFTNIRKCDTHVAVLLEISTGQIPEGKSFIVFAIFSNFKV